MCPSDSVSPEDCPFCAIGSGADPAAEVVCEGGAWIAFFPLEPATLGHTLVVPRAHVSDLWSASDELGGELIAAAVSVGKAIQRALGPEGMNLISSAGEAAEQTVAHLHLHLLPRWRGDGFGPLWASSKQVPRAALRVAAGEIRGECARG